MPKNRSSKNIFYIKKSFLKTIQGQMHNKDYNKKCIAIHNYHLARLNLYMSINYTFSFK